MGRTVALIGALHPAARGLALRLEDDPAVERVLGFSAQEPPLLGPKFEFVRAAPGSERFAAALAEADAVALFPLMDTGVREPGLGAAALEVAELTLRAATGSSTVVLWSSGVVYGAHPHNPVPIPESQQPRPNDDFAPASELADVERAVLGAAASDGAGRTVTVLRAGAIWAPSWGTFLGRALQAPALMGVRGYDPPLQALDPEDATGALALAIRGELPGTYNVAPADWVPAREAARAAGRRRLQLPEPLAFGTAERLRRLGVSSAEPGELRYHMHPWVLDSSRLRAAGWAPRSTTAEALAAAARTPPDGVAVGGLHVRRTDLYKGAAAGVAVIASIALVRRQARRRPSGTSM